MAVTLAAGAALVTPATAETPAAGAAHEPRWEISLAGSLPDGAWLKSVTSAGRSAWAVGSESIYEGTADGVVLRWDGRRWRQDRDPALPPVHYWNSVDASSAHDVWAYGWNDDGEYVVRHDGRRWRQVPPPELPGGENHGAAEVAAGSHRVWLAGREWLSTYAHGSWTSEKLPRGVDVIDVDSRSSRSAWAVGGFWHVGEESRPLVMRWQDGAWTETAAPDDPDLRLTDVHVASDRSVWAAGRVPAADGEGFAEPRVYHWNGRTWRDVTGPVAGLFAESVTGDGRGGIWLSGDPYGWAGPPVFWHYDGHRWTRHEGAAVTAGETQAHEVSDLAPGTWGGGPWAVGSYAHVEGTTAYQHELIERLGRR
ncbi:hypothetical protein GCM10009802_25680 [Streptomyces synnematoformans]|uniref:Uncharacterized protein n=1 Tax=Streptomyces synnematoformans TaxID=415721 RepID=A0ABP5JY02_9ACTN